MILSAVSPAELTGQRAPGRKAPVPNSISLGIHADPVFSWFDSDIDAVSNKGVRPGFCFGLTVNRYFSQNYSFSTGINILSAGGNLVSDSTTGFYLSKNNILQKVSVPRGEPITYKIQYISVPLGLKLQTNQIGYLTFFSDIGIDPKIVIGGKADIPSIDIEDGKVNKELRPFNISYHVMAGIEYGIGGNTAFILGLGFDNNFLDITKERDDQPDDKISHRLLSFRFGIIF
jgi:hypothetical protein